jgi:hypothetical protein
MYIELFWFIKSLHQGSPRQKPKNKHNTNYHFKYAPRIIQIKMYWEQRLFWEVAGKITNNTFYKQLHLLLFWNFQNVLVFGNHFALKKLLAFCEVWTRSVRMCSAIVFIFLLTEQFTVAINTCVRYICQIGLFIHIFEGSG